MSRRAVRIRIYCAETDKVGHTPLVTAVVRLLWDRHAAGVTVFRGVEGFGAAHRLHHARLADLGGDLPVLVEWLDTPERADAVWPELEPMLRRAVVTREDVEMLVEPHQHPEAG